jgi:hypothetical protein
MSTIETGGEYHPTAEIHGTCPDRFSRVRDVLAENLATGDDIGASARFSSTVSRLSTFGADILMVRSHASGNATPSSVLIRPRKQ